MDLLETAPVAIDLPLDMPKAGSFAVGPGTGIPEDFDPYTFVVKLAQLGTTVVTCLGFAEEADYNLPASLMPRG
jgi:hypothetical protein